MAKKKGTKEISFTIDFIELVNKSLTLPINKDGKVPEYRFDVDLDIRSNEKEKKSLHTLHVAIKSKEDESLLGNVSVACAFNILNYEDLIDSEVPNSNIPKEYLDILSTITIGTARGIIFSEFRGTFLHDATLPILDVKSFTASE
ncbi:hypothetical protein HRH25_09400 [Flavisolibacter sp. BT320]|nr:hypothetical protein [Flavisolibacter longurius]